MAFKKELEVFSHDIDTNRFAAPTSVVRYMQEAVDSNLRECKPTYEELLEQNLSFIVSRTALEVYRPLKEYEKISVETWATEGKTAVFPRSFIIKSGEETVAKCLMIWALVNTREHRFMRGSEFSVKSYGTGEAVELTIPSRFKISTDIMLKKCGQKTVMYSDIDRNFHMNNTKYFDMLFDYIPNRAKIFMSSCLVNYVSEAPLGSNIEIYISDAVYENGETIYYMRTEIDGKTNIEAKVGVKDIDR
ncbi:MAG: hypothetical protein J6Q56_01720 [Clostridia bacterium]|nr:hypothetical protein [Clostridia bacterium]